MFRVGQTVATPLGDMTLFRLERHISPTEKAYPLKYQEGDTLFIGTGTGKDRMLWEVTDPSKALIKPLGSES